MIVPFIGIKAIDVVITALAWRRSRIMNITRNLVIAVLMTLVTTLMLGVIYPLAITGIAQVAFPSQANGQLIETDGRTIGSRDHRAGILVAGLLPAAAVGDRHGL